MMDPAEFSAFEAAAKAMGFVAMGFSRPGRPLFFDPMKDWISAGMHGHMRWLQRNMELREDPERLLPGCRAIISLAYPYGPHIPATPDGFKASRYTEPEKADYHSRLKALARPLALRLSEAYPGTRSRICVDSAPILERSIAFGSGVGFIGKNTTLIVPRHGSYVFLVEILTTAPLSVPDPVPLSCGCGSCTRCMDACPTGALERPFWLNASKCLSYLTIEYPGEVTRETGRKMNGCIAGCDVCQEVCPFNPHPASQRISLPSTQEILMMAPEAFQRRFGHTTLSRVGLEKLKDNVRAALSASLLPNS